MTVEKGYLQPARWPALNSRVNLIRERRKVWSREDHRLAFRGLSARPGMELGPTKVALVVWPHGNVLLFGLVQARCDVADVVEQ